MLKRLITSVIAFTMVVGLSACTKPAETTTTAGTTTAGTTTAGATTAGTTTAGATTAGTTTAAGNGYQFTKQEAGSYHIGIVTGTVSQGEDELRGAEALIKKYKTVDEGGMIKHVTYPDNFDQEQEATIQAITQLSNDPKMKAIIVNQAVPGTVAAFKKIRETRPDILLLANSSQEDPKMIDAAADMIVDPDNINRGYLIPWVAKELGAKKFVHISFPRHMSIELLSQRKNIMKEACKDLGLEFIEETAPDPMSDVKVAGAKKYIQDQMPAWVEKYGKDTAFFATNDAQTEPLLNRVASLGAIFVEPDLPSPIMGYPAALNISLTEEAGNWPAILAKVEEAVKKTPGSGRMGTWAFSYGFTGSEGFGEFAKGVIEGTYKFDSKDDLISAFKSVTPGAEWNGSLYVDNQTGQTKTNHIMVYQDTYVFGRGYMGATKVVVPEKYYTIKND